MISLILKETICKNGEKRLKINVFHNRSMNIKYNVNYLLMVTLDSLGGVGDGD